MLRGELARAEAFASLALNEWAANGPRLKVTSVYDDILYQGGADAGEN